MSSAPMQEAPEEARNTATVRTVTPTSSDYDVVCNRGELAKKQNEPYRALIREFSPAYTVSRSWSLKRMMADEVVKIIKSNGGKFLDGKTGEELDPIRARKKVMKALKDFRRQDPKTSSPRSSRKALSAAKKAHGRKFGETTDPKLLDLPSLPPLPQLNKPTADTKAAQAEQTGVFMSQAKQADEESKVEPSVDSILEPEMRALSLGSMDSLSIRSSSKSAVADRLGSFAFPPEKRTPSLTQSISSFPFASQSALEPLAMKTPSSGEAADALGYSEQELNILQGISH